MALFRFKSRTVADPLAQRNFEQLEGVLPSGFLALAATLAAGRQISFGAGSITFTASANSATLAVNHGLAATPVAVFAIGVTAGGGVYYETSGYTTSQFTIQGFLRTAGSGSPSFVWAAIG